VERFIAVCHPLRARSLCTWNRAKRYTMGVVVFSILVNAPRWAELYTARNAWRPNDLILLMTPLRCDETYIRIYVQWTNFILMSLIPIAALVVLNLIIYTEVRSCSIQIQLASRQSMELPLLSSFCLNKLFMLRNSKG
jgi:hypothetical protein